jgi:hypothetical protein
VLLIGAHPPAPEEASAKERFADPNKISEGLKIKISLI